MSLISYDRRNGGRNGGAIRAARYRARYKIILRFHQRENLYSCRIYDSLTGLPSRALRHVQVAAGTKKKRETYPCFTRWIQQRLSAHAARGIYTSLLRAAGMQVCKSIWRMEPHYRVGPARDGRYGGCTNCRRR